jgi:hypothetical protein
LAENLLGNAPIGSPVLFGHFLKYLHYSGSIAEKVSNTFRAFPNESPIPFNCSNGLQELLGAFAIGIDFVISFTFPLKQHVSVLLRLKIEDTTEKFQNHQRFFSQL